MPSTVRRISRFIAAPAYRIVEHRPQHVAMTAGGLHSAPISLRTIHPVLCAACPRRSCITDVRFLRAARSSTATICLPSAAVAISAFTPPVSVLGHSTAGSIDSKMPRRTNDFQQLIALIHRQLAPSGSTVTESHMVRDSTTGDLREVDVSIEYELAGVPVRLLIECRDRGRPADVEWIDQLVGKYSGPAGRIVAVSRSGFTQQAIAKAAAVGIAAMTISEATDLDWVAWVKNLDRIWVTFVFTSPVGVTSINLVDKTILPSDFPPMRQGDVRFVGPDGSSLGNALDIYNNQIGRPGMTEALNRAERLPTGEIKFGLRLAPGTFTEMANGPKFAAEGIVYLIREETELIEVPLKAGQYAARSVATGSGVSTTWKVTVAYVKDKDGQPQMSLNVSRADGKTLPGGHIELYGANPL